jgi:hypothetical protein
MNTLTECARHNALIEVTCRRCGRTAYFEPGKLKDWMGVGDCTPAAVPMQRMRVAGVPVLPGARSGSIDALSAPAEASTSLRRRGDKRIMISDRDVFAAAKLMIKRHGEEAAAEAAKRADALLEEGDAVGSTVWGKIAKAIEELLRKAPEPGAAVH